MSAANQFAAVRGSLHNLPTELILDIIRSIPFSPVNLSSLRSTCRRFDAIATYYEQSLSENIRTLQFNIASRQFFPSFKIHNYQTLFVLHNRLETLDSLHNQWLRITNHSPELDWLSGRWEGVHKAGLLLLYRLHDHESYQQKILFLRSLPKTSLACLFFKLISSVRILRIHGPDPIRGTYAAGDVMARSDIELAFEEMMLQYGPKFFIAMLNAEGFGEERRDDWAVRVLRTEIEGMLERQAPEPDGKPKPSTLISQLRRAFAASAGCEINQNINRMWEILSSTSFDDMNEAKLIQVVIGHELTGGMKRMGI